MTIHVRQDHIAAGQRRNPYADPIALAASEALGRPVWAGNWTLRDLNLAVIAPLPPVAQGFVAKFDEGEDVEPIEFSVEVAG